MAEELQIKVNVDSGNADTKIDSLAKGFDKGAGGAKQMSQETQAMVQGLNRLTRLNIFGGLFNTGALGKIKNINAQINGLTPKMKDLKKEMRDASKEFNSVVSKISKVGTTFQNGSGKVLPRKYQKAYKGLFNNLLDDDYRKSYSALVNTSHAKNNQKLEAIKNNPNWKEKVKDPNSSYYYSYKAIQNEKAQYKKDRELIKAADRASKAQKTVAERKDAMKQLRTDQMGILSAALKGPLIAGAIGIAVTVILKTIQKIKKTIQEINQLWTTSLQNNINTQYKQQLDYLQAYLGVSQEQLMTILEEDTDTVKTLLNRQKDLGGVATDEQINAVKKLNQATTDLKEAWNNMWYNLVARLAPALEWCVDLLTAYFAVINNNFSSESYGEEAVENLKNGAEQSNLIRKNLMGFDQLNVLSSNMSTTNSNAGEELVSESSVTRLGKMMNFVQKVKQIIKDWNLDMIFSQMFGTVFKGFRDFKNGLEFINTWKADGFKAAMKGVWDDVASPWITLGETIKGWISKIDFEPLWTALKVGAEVTWNAIKIGASAIWDGLKIGADLAWKAIKLGAESLWTALKNGAKGFGNFFINIFNKVIDGLNKISFKAPDWKWLGDVAGKSWGVNIAKIPTLANGGVIKNPTIAMMGEYSGAMNNPEIVAPQSILQETINASNGELAGVFAQVGRQIIQAINSKDMTVSIDDNAIARSAARGNDAYRKITGKAMIRV